MVLSYGSFGAQTRFPGGVYSVTLYLTVGGATKGIPAPIFVDDSISVPELHWEVGGSLAPKVKYLLFPPGEMYPSPVRLTAANWPMTGEVVKLPGLGIKAASVSMPISAPQPVMPPPQPPIMPATMVGPPTILPAPGPTPAPAPVNQAINTGLVTAVDTAGGKVDLPVYIAPVPKAEIVPGPGGGLVVVVPKDQISNLPVKPSRVMPKGVPGDESPLSYSAEMWRTYFTFPPTGRLPVNTRAAQEAARIARGMAEEADVETDDLILTTGGVFDREGRPFPMTTPLRTLPTAPPSPSGLMPAKPGIINVLDATVRTDGKVIERTPPKVLPMVPVTPSAPAAGGMSLLPLLGAAGAGFLVAGPVGAGVGAVVGFLITPKQAVSK